jgi:AcrR family transcriptional regulator
LIDSVNQKVGIAMPRTEEEHQRIREEQKKHILEAAVRVFARKGLAATKMADIATEANVSYGLAYHYFPNKERILDELLEESLQMVARTTQQALEMPGTPWDRLHWLVSKRIQGLQEHPEFIMVFHQALTDEATRSKWREVAHKKNDYLIEVLKRLITEGQSAGQIACDDVDQLVTALKSCLHGLTFSALSQDQTQHLPDACIILRLLKPS